MFDWFVVEKIRSLGADLAGIGELMSRHSAEELARLRWLFEEMAPDTDLIAIELNKISQHSALAKKIFFDFKKKGNPYIDHSEVVGVCGAGGFQFAPFKTLRTKLTPDTHRTLILGFFSQVSG